MELNPLTALSPIDGRYARQTDALRDIFSECAFMNARVVSKWSGSSVFPKPALLNFRTSATTQGLPARPRRQLLARRLRSHQGNRKDDEP